MKKKFIIITSIYEPSEAIKLFAELEDWQLVVAGDTKTPKEWNFPGVVYLSPKDQENMNSSLIKKIPWKTYSRKMAGYLYAIENGAELIADTDDDNIPYEDWGVNIDLTIDESIDSKGFVNMYKYYTDLHVWPRGYPLNLILNKSAPKIIENNKYNTKIGIWQFLADEDPDVDAIYRLTNNKPIYFNKRAQIKLEAGTICPFNSQNTFFRKETFPLLYLPVFVNFRFTDILRGLVAQPILWAANYSLAFGHATAIQKRNPHDYLIDFESEIPCYLYPEKIIETVASAISKSNSISQNMMAAYLALYENKIIVMEEIDLLEAWLTNF